MKNQKIVIANWKMNPDTYKEAKKNFDLFKKAKKTDKNVTTVFCPPIQYIKDLKKSYKGNKIFFGAQDVFYKNEGAYTGEISPYMIKDAGARFVIVGHSERRALGESNNVIANKVKNSLEFGFHTIFCIGEKQRDFDGSYLNEIKSQIAESLIEIPKNAFNKLIIAYEPVWAIGTGKKAIDAKEMHFVSLFIQKQLIKLFGKKVANDVSIIYGGSIDSENAGQFIKESDIEGLLVGRASLNPYEFAKIITNVSKSIS